MIEAVTRDQEHFRVPTLRTDARGLVVGDRGLLRFRILPQLVSFFQALTEEQSLDHMASSLRIIKVRSRTSGLEFLVDIPVLGSYLMDRAASIARLLQGEVYTGAWPHFVPYRDRRSPFGYDASHLDTWENGAVLYDLHGQSQFEIVGELTFSGLLLDLSMARTKAIESNNCMLKVEPGLRAPLQSFLWRRKVEAKIAQVGTRPQGQFEASKSYYLFQLPKAPQHLYALFEGVPGLEVYHSFGKNLFVERGWSHPFALENCRRYFAAESHFFFSGTKDRVEVINSDGLVFVDIAKLEAQGFRFAAHSQLSRGEDIFGQPDAVFDGVALGERLDYEVKLTAIPSATVEQVRGAWLTSQHELRWLKRIVFSLPQSALNDYRAAFTDRGVLIVNPRGIEWVPLGLQLKEIFSGVYIPLGTRFVPPVGYEHLAKALGIERGFVYVIPEMRYPIEIQDTYLKPLARYMLADVELQQIRDKAPREQFIEDQAIPLHSAEAGLFSLWAQNIFKPGLY